MAECSPCLPRRQRGVTGCSPTVGQKIGEHDCRAKRTRFPTVVLASMWQGSRKQFPLVLMDRVVQQFAQYDSTFDEGKIPPLNKHCGSVNENRVERLSQLHGFLLEWLRIAYMTFRRILRARRHSKHPSWSTDVIPRARKTTVFAFGGAALIATQCLCSTRWRSKRQKKVSRLLFLLFISPLIRRQQAMCDTLHCHTSSQTYKQWNAHNSKVNYAHSSTNAKFTRSLYMAMFPGLRLR